MQPLSAWPLSVRSRIDVLLSDIDDTMTRDGKLPAESYRAMWDLSDAGVAVIPVTGRPAGWCDLICRQWPVAGVIGENGAFVFTMDGKRLEKIYHPSAPDPSVNRDRLSEIAAEVYREIPGTRPAKDQFSRLFDVAIDFREEPPLLGYEVANAIKAIFERHGAQAKVSSIHVNAWYGSYDKRSMAHHFLAARFGIDVDAEPENLRAVFCGDSPNDEPMFAAFRNSIGVANIAPFAGGLTHGPAYLTRGESADGFVEVARAILDAKPQKPA